jgi:hypothetical protein
VARASRGRRGSRRTEGVACLALAFRCLADGALLSQDMLDSFFGALFWENSGPKIERGMDMGDHGLEAGGPCAIERPVDGLTGLRINETATRARAGLLNVLSAVTMFLLIAWPELDPVRYVGPFVVFDMAMAAGFGLTPLSPTGVLGTLLTRSRPPTWAPVKPKRFAWTLGGIMGTTCFGFWFFSFTTPWIVSVLAICFALTWLEGNLGFCAGCWLYTSVLGCEPCGVSRGEP